MLWLVWLPNIGRISVSAGVQSVLLVLGLPAVLFGSLFSLVFEKPFLTYRSLRDLREWLNSLAGKQRIASDDDPERQDVSPGPRERVGASV
jgi:hypothetical protein